MESINCPPIVEKRSGSVLCLRLNRPDALNALDLDLASQLYQAVKRAAADPEVRVVVLTGTGRAFCVGADLKALLAASASVQAVFDFLDDLLQSFEIMRSCEKPIIGALNGLTLAGGLELALCCDVLFAAESTRIGDAHSNYGLIPGAGGAAILPRRIGLQRAKALLFSGEDLPAQTMMEWGLVYRVLPDSLFEEEVHKFAELLATKSPLALRAMKSVANAALDTTEATSLRNEHLALLKHVQSIEFREGLASFVEKRKARY